MRQKSDKELNWVSIVQGNPTQILIEPFGIPVGDYKLILESFDENGLQKSPLQEDLVTLHIQLGCSTDANTLANLENALLAKPI